MAIQVSRVFIQQAQLGPNTCAFQTSFITAIINYSFLINRPIKNLATISSLAMSWGTDGVAAFGAVCWRTLKAEGKKWT